MAQPLNALSLLQQYQANDQARALGSQQLQLGPIKQQALLMEIARAQQEMDQKRSGGTLSKLQQMQMALEARKQQATERYQQGRLSRMAEAIRARGATQGRPPAGYRPTKEGNLEAIPGGPADIKMQNALNQDTQVLQNTQAELDRLQLEANRLLKHPGLSKTTGLMSWAPLVGGLATVPGTEAADFKSGLETLKSQTGFSVLQNLRNNSKTGGALGQVSDFENRMLQANLASLDTAQSEEEFKSALKKITEYTEQAKTRLRGAYDFKYKGAGKRVPLETTPTPKNADKGGGWSIRPIP